MAPREREDISYFGAGPALLPTDVLASAAQALVNYKGTGLGLAEHSHRSALAGNILNEVKADLVSYLDIPEDYEVLLMQGGGTGQFSATALNLVGSWVLGQHQRLLTDEAARMQQLRETINKHLKLDYLVTGSWSQKAAAEATRLLGPRHVNIATDARKHSSDGKFGSIPDESTWTLSHNAAMVYYCDNETVDGVEFPAFPRVLEPGPDGSGPIVVADMSSNILSRRLPIRNFSLIFFGAQKNLGTTGITIVVIKKSLLAQPPPDVMRALGLPQPPVMLQYEMTAKNNSLYNTLSIFDVYVAGQVLKKLLATYPDAVDGQEAVSLKKAQLIYGALDSHADAYTVIPTSEARSRMNICFRVVKGGDVDAAEKAFLAEAEKLGLTGLKGHRSVGGIRASNYNSISLEDADKLARFLVAFAKA